MGNKLKLGIRNFQIISKADLEFEKGINIIVGASGNGKSSILRAIRTLLLNSSGSQKFIKHDTDSTLITVEYNNNVIEWKRTQKNSEYTINGEKYSKLGTSNLSKVLQDNGFVIDDKNDILNLEGAWQVLFPYDKSDAELFKLFENIFCVSDSGKIFQTFKVQEDKLNKELQESNDSLSKNKLKIEAIESIENKVDVNKLKEYKITLSNLNNGYSNLAKDISSVKSISAYVNLLSENLSIINFNLSNLDTYKSTLEDYEKIKVVIKYIRLLKSSDTKVKIFSLNNLDNYSNLYKDIKFIESANKYPVVESSNKVFNKSLIENYSSISKDIKTIKQLEKYPLLPDSDKKIFDLDNLSCYTDIKKKIEKVNSLVKELRELKETKESIDKEIEELRVKISEHDCKQCEECQGKGYTLR